jgi:hypothetical protein
MRLTNSDENEVNRENLVPVLTLAFVVLSQSCCLNIFSSLYVQLRQMTLYQC